jgi:hypothetical protein
MEFYSATKKNEILSFAGKWVELENIIFLKKFFYSFIHMCISCLGYSSPLPLSPSLSLPTPLAPRQNLFCPYL